MDNEELSLDRIRLLQTFENRERQLWGFYPIVAGQGKIARGHYKGSVASFPAMEHDLWRERLEGWLAENVTRYEVWDGLYWVYLYSREDYMKIQLYFNRV